MDAYQAIQNITALGRGTNDGERADIRSKQSEIMEHFKGYLAQVYGNDLPKQINEAVWEQAFTDGKSSGLQYVESRYDELAEFAANILKLAQQ